MTKDKKSKGVTNIVLIIIITVLAVTILYDFFGGKATTTGPNGQSVMYTDDGSDVFIPGLDAYAISYDEDTNKLAVTLRNNGDSVLEITAIRIAKVDMDPDSYEEELKMVLAVGEVKKLKITPPHVFHKIDFIGSEPTLVTTIWHEGPVEIIGGKLRGMAEMAECTGIQNLDYYNVTFDADAHKVYVTLENTGDQIIHIDEIRIAKVDMDPDSYTEEFNVVLEPGEVKIVTIIPPDPFDKLDFLEATGCNYVVFWNGEAISGVDGIISGDTYGTNTTSTSTENCRPVEDLDYYNVVFDKDENTLTVTFENKGDKAVVFDRILIAEVDMDPDSYLQEIDIVTIESGNVVNVSITPPDPFDKIDFLEQVGCDFAVVWNGGPVKYIEGTPS